MTSPKLKQLPKAPLPNSITWRVRAPPYEFRGDTNIHPLQYSTFVFPGIFCLSSALFLGRLPPYKMARLTPLLELATPEKRIQPIVLPRP